MKTKLNALFVLLSFSIWGCSSIVTQTEQYRLVTNLVEQEKFAEAASLFEKNKHRYFDSKDRVLYWIDEGLLRHYAYQDSQAIVELQSADFAIEELFTKSISKGMASMVLNDNALDYSGEDFENIYINVFKALSFYRLGSTEEALVEIRRLIEKFHMLEEKYREEYSLLQNSDEIKTDIEDITIDFYSSALAHYLSMILFLADGEYDDARISKEKFDKAFSTQPTIYNFSKPNLDNFIVPSNYTKLTFLSFIGNAPLKYEYIFKIDTYKDLIIVSEFKKGRWRNYSRINWYGVESGIHAKFAIPRMGKRGTAVSRVEVYVDEHFSTDLFKIESLEDIALETFKREEGIVFLKSLARTVTKAIANEALNKELDKETGGGEWGNLTRLISGAIINSTENADLRSSHYLPAFAFGGEVNLKPGKHKIEIVYKDRYNQEIARDIFDNYEVNKKIDLLETVFLK